MIGSGNFGTDGSNISAHALPIICGKPFLIAAGAIQPVHWFHGRKGLDIHQGTSLSSNSLVPYNLSKGQFLHVSMQLFRHGSSNEGSCELPLCSNSKWKIVRCTKRWNVFQPSFCMFYINYKLNNETCDTIKRSHPCCLDPSILIWNYISNLKGIGTLLK